MFPITPSYIKDQIAKGKKTPPTAVICSLAISVALLCLARFGMPGNGLV